MTRTPTDQPHYEPSVAEQAAIVILFFAWGIGIYLMLAARVGAI